MISNSQRQKIAKYFPEMTIEEFIKRFSVPDTNLNIMTLDECQNLDKRIIEVAQDLCTELAFEEQEYESKQKAVDNVIERIICDTALGKRYSYTNEETKDDFCNMGSDNKIALTNDLSRKVFANVVARAMIHNGELEDPQSNQHRAAILKSMWFSVIKIGERIDNWSMAESSKMKRMRSE